MKTSRLSLSVLGLGFLSIISNGCNYSELGLAEYDLPVQVEARLMSEGKLMTDFAADIEAAYGIQPSSAQWVLPTGLAADFTNFEGNEEQKNFDIDVTHTGWEWKTLDTSAGTLPLSTSMTLKMLATEIDECSGSCDFKDEETYPHYADAIGESLIEWASSTGVFFPTVNSTSSALRLYVQGKDASGLSKMLKFTPVGAQYTCDVDADDVGQGGVLIGNGPKLLSFAKAIDCTIRFNMTADPHNGWLCSKGDGNYYPCPR